jgi:hypothetical protein
MNFDFSALQWLFVAIVSPVLGWIGGWLPTWLRGKRRKKRLLVELSGLPPEAKAKLVEFHHHGAHTLRGDPMAPVVELLVSRGHLTVGPGAGGYHAVNRYLSVAPHVWEVMADWIAMDPIAHHIDLELLQQALDRREHDNAPQS